MLSAFIQVINRKIALLIFTVSIILKPSLQEIYAKPYTETEVYLIPKCIVLANFIECSICLLIQ